MKTLKIKELGLFIIFILSGLLCGLMGVFAIPINKQAFAEEPSKIEISNDEANPWTQSNGKYSCNVRGGLLSETKTTLTITIEGNGLLNFSYTKSNGDLSISYNGETLNKSSSGTLNVILINEGSNVITISCSGPAPLRTGKASVGPFTLTTPTYKISAVSNNTEFGNVYFQNDDYVIGKEVTVTSVIEEGCIFLGYLDQDKNILSTNQVYTFNVTKDLQITGVFARLDGSNTNQDPYQFNNIMSVVNDYCLDNSSLTYILIPNGICADYYIAENLDYSLVIDSVTQIATDGKYHLSLQRGETKYVNFVSGLKTFIFVITNPGTGIASSTITLGGGTDLDPYLISTEDNLQQIDLSLSSVFKIVNDIYITKDFTPLGNSSTKFTGKLIGNNKTIYNLKTSVGDYRGLFAYTYGASIQDLNLEDANIYAKSYGAFLIAYSENKTTINNVHVSGVLHYTVNDSVFSNWGGLVGFAVNDSGLRASNCSVAGTIDGNAYTQHVGGFSGSGGTFSNCIMKAEVTGISVVGGMTSGYSGSKLANNSNFSNCFVEGSIKMMGQFKNNYPYVGLINGYGAWETYGVTGSGQNISMNLTTVNSDITVENITIFGSNVSPDGINVAFNKNGNKYSFKKSVVITKTCGLANVSIGDVLSGNISALSETSVTGITSNYGGLTIRIKMSNGTYKYVSTLNKKTNAIESNFDINLDDLTSYVNNFSNIEIDTTIGTSSDNDKGDGIATWGTALVTNANDFEHLSWIISGGIPTTFKNDIYYNSRSVATISIKLLNDIDLTAPRYAKLTNNILSLYAENEEVLDNSFVLNSKDNSNIENLNYNFEGLGRSEMSPYRGSLYGNSKTLTINMNFPNAHLVGIINISTEQKEKIYVKNLTVEGTIVGGYKVGIVGMQDNYERSTALYFVEVTNNANISAKSQVGGLLGGAQGEASIFAENCVNNGNITATDGDAGGLLGSLAYYTSSPATCKLTNCQNNGRVSATQIAGGLVATTNGATISGENSNSGVVLGETKENCYVGEFLKTSTYTYENGKLVTIYKLNLGTPNFEYTINDTSFIAQQDGNIFARFENQPIVEGLSIIVSGALKTSSYSFDANKYTMFTDLSGIFPKEFALLNEEEYKLIKTEYPEISANDYDISENEFNDIKMLVTFGNNTYSVITVTPNITNNQYQSNQLIFVNTSFTHNDYNIPNTVVETLKRISTGVKEFTTLVDSLTTKTSGTNSEFYTLGYNIKTRLDSLTLELTAYSQNDLTRFKAYVNSNATTKNNEDIFNVLQTYFNNIVSSSNISEMLSNISLNYGTYSFSKPLTFNMLSGITPNPTKTITYSGAKEDITLNEDNSFSLVLQTEGVSFSAYGITTFSYNSPCSVQINKLDFSVVFTNETFTYDGTKKELQTAINCVENDDVGIKVLYLKQDETEPKQTNIGVGTYSVIIDELTGDDSIYYNFPTYEYGELIISPISVTLNVQDNQSFTYNKENVSPEVSINGLTLNTNYIITFSGENYSSNEAPINAGAYTASISLLQNFYSLNKTSYNFTINPKPITNITLNTIKYCNQNANTKIIFESFEGLIEDDSINTVTYEIYDKAGDISLAKTVGEYSVYISAIDNSNYTVENLTQSFTLNVIPTEVEISLNPLTSVYGENVSNVLNTLTCSVTNGILYDDISALNIVAVKEGGNNVGEYNLSANYNNNNYNVTFVDSIHTIAPLKVEIDFKQTSFMYNATNQIESIKPEVKIVENQEGVTENNTALSNDIKYFTFSLYLNNIKVEEFINFGDYLLKLDEHEILANYTITKTQQTYKITKYNVNINISADNVEETYNKLLTLDKFSITHTNLLQNDEITDLVSVEYKVYKGEEIINNISYLDVGLYTIKLIVTPNNSENSKYNNYNLGDISNGELHIIERQTYIELENNKITKIYDLTPCVISAKLFALDGEEITGAEFVYEIYCNGEKMDEAIEVGHYDVVITALSDGNNEEALASCSIDITANNVEFSLTNNEKTYNALAFDLQHTMTFDVQVDISNYVRYKFLDSNKQETKNITSAGNYFVEFSIVDENEEINDNFVIKNSVLSFNINPIDLSIKVEDKQITYNEPFNIDNCNYILLSGELLQGEELDLIYSVKNLSTNAGTYTITATNYNTNYNVVINAGTLTINKIILKLTYFGKDSLEYNQNGQAELLQVQVNNALSNDVYSVYYLNSKNIKVENVVNVDMYRLVVKINDTTNYAFENTTDTIISRNIEIYKKVLDIKIVVSNKVYDGEYINIDSITVNNQTLLEDLYLLEFYKDSVLISIPKDNGTYTVKVVEKDKENYQFINNSKEFTIYIKDLTIKDIETTYYYNKTKIQPSLELLEVVTKETKEDVVLNYSHESNGKDFIEIGEYSIKINGLSGEQAYNYKLSSTNDIIYTINPQVVSYVVNNNEFNFNNIQLLASDLNIEFSHSFVKTSDYSLSELPTKADTHNIYITSLNEGIEFTENSFQVVINKIDIEGVVFEDKTFIYDNQPHSLTATNLVMPTGITLNIEYSLNCFVDVGNYDVTITLTNENYNTKQITKALTIMPNTITVAISNTSSFTYNKTKQGVEVVGLNNLWYKNLININYVGEDYNSTEKPINAGDYNLTITAKDNNNIIITNEENPFVINRKRITLQNLSTQSATYTKTTYNYNLQFGGVIEDDEVSVNILYNNKQDLPFNAGQYIVSFNGLSGKDAKNYEIENSQNTAMFVINKKDINVIIHGKSINYGDEDVSLTYTAEPLYNGDTFTGNVVREQGNTVNSYIISKGSLSAGDNYNLHVTNAIYSINQRQLDYESFETEFTYSSLSMIPNVVFKNIVNNDKNVVNLKTIGDTVNAGSYTLQFVLLNSNYKLPDNSIFEITINKADASGEILGLMVSEKDYNGLEFEPLVDTKFNYSLKYKVNNEFVSKILNSNVYTVIVEIIDANFKGTKEFNFVVNKIYYPSNVIDNISIECASNYLMVKNLNNIAVSVDNENFVDANIIDGLNEDTLYTLFVKVKESENYLDTVFNVGEFKTSLSGLILNDKIIDILNNGIRANEIQEIKQIFEDVKNLSLIELEKLNEQNFTQLQNEYNNYFAQLNNEVEKVKSVSDLVDFSYTPIVNLFSGLTVCIGLFIAGKRRGKDEN